MQRGGLGSAGSAAIPPDSAAFPFKRDRNAPARYACQGCLGDLLLCISICFVQKRGESRAPAACARRETSSVTLQEPRFGPSRAAGQPASLWEWILLTDTWQAPEKTHILSGELRYIQEISKGLSLQKAEDPWGHQCRHHDNVVRLCCPREQGKHWCKLVLMCIKYTPDCLGKEAATFFCSERGWGQSFHSESKEFKERST